MGRDLESVLDALLEGVVVLGSDGTAQLLNVEACRILEVSSDAAVGSTLEEILGNEHPIPALARRVNETARPAVGDDLAIERRYEGELQVDVTVSPIFEGREANGSVVILRDQTVSNSLRDMISQRERLVSYGHIAAGIAHEVKNPLGGIRGAAELLARKIEDERSKRAADLIVREVDRITALVEDLMVFARGESLKSEPVNIHRMLDSVLDLLSMDPLAFAVEAKRIFDPSIPELIGDGDRLTQVFLNVARNALQAMEGREASVLTITTRMALEHRLAGRSGRGGVPTVEIAFSDNGPGISREILGQLDTPFFTTKARGTGLGLAVSRHWVARHGGTLQIESEDGKGARVVVHLPLRGPEPGEGSEA